MFMFKAAAEYWDSKGHLLLATEKGSGYGREIARLQTCLNFIVQALILTKKSTTIGTEGLIDLKNTATERLEEAKSDNDKIYLEPVPKVRKGCEGFFCAATLFLLVAARRAPADQEGRPGQAPAPHRGHDEGGRPLQRDAKRGGQEGEGEVREGHRGGRQERDCLGQHYEQRREGEFEEGRTAGEVRTNA